MQGPAFGGGSLPRSLQVWKQGRLWLHSKEHAHSPFHRENWIQYLTVSAPADGSFWTETLLAPCHGMARQGTEKGTLLPSARLLHLDNKPNTSYCLYKHCQQKLLNRKTQLNTASPAFVQTHSQGEGLSWCSSNVFYNVELIYINRGCGSHSSSLTFLCSHTIWNNVWPRICGYWSPKLVH